MTSKSGRARAPCVIYNVKGVKLERPAHAWDHVARLATRFDAPGCRIAVKDESGDIAIPVGARTAKQMLAAHAS
jgi:hypothetical protein